MEKTYSDFMNSISSDELYEGLLSWGLFNEKLPPIFTSVPFYQYCKTLNHEFSGKATQFIYYESMRNINVPRPLGIPNPMSYERLCKILSQNWDKLKLHFKKNCEGQDYKISRIHLRKMVNTKCLFEMNYKKYIVDGTPEPNLLIGSRYVVHADISNCFPSIYTHSLCWALVGKEEAKQNIRKSNLWYNLIDSRTSNIKDKETHGLLIGPHASNLLSEIILTSIDKILYDEGWRYVRNIDDYTCYVPNYEDGQRFLVRLAEELRNYDLLLNHKKTSIDELPLASVVQWVRKINSLSFINNEKILNYKELQSYLDFSIELMHENNMDSSVLKYAIKVLSGMKFTKNATQLYIKTIFHLALLYPYVVPLLDRYIFSIFEVDKSEIQSISEKIFTQGISNKNYEQVCFSLYFSLKYNFTLISSNDEFIKTCNDCITILMGYLHSKQFDTQSEQQKYVDYASSLAKSLDDFNRNWVFIYEALPQSMLTEDWRHMKKANVSFIKTIGKDGQA